MVTTYQHAVRRLRRIGNWPAELALGWHALALAAVTLFCVTEALLP